MKKYKVRIKAAPQMNYGGMMPRYQTGQEVPELTEEEKAAMLYGAQPVVGPMNGAVTLAPTDANYPVNMASSAGYQGPSVYDYLTSQGKKGDYNSRKEIAKSLGIQNYKGTAEQNLAMLEALRGNQPQAKIVSSVVKPSTSKQAIPTQKALTKKAANTPQQHSLLNDLTNTLTGSRSYEEYSQKHPYFFDFMGVDDKSSSFVKGLDAIPHHFEDAIAKLVYNGDPMSALEIGALIAGNRFLGRGAKGPKALPPGPNPRLLTQPPKGGFTMPGRGGLGNFTYAFGGDLAAMAYGGQYGHSLDLGSRVIDNEMGKPDPYAVSDTLQAVPRDMANLEAERGETAYGDLDDDGEMEHSKIGGKRHSQGGTPLNLKPGTFIYSDTKSMKLRGQDLAQFGKSASSKKSYTPAQIAKQYELNKYKAILEDPNADPYQKRTAEMMMNNNKFKLAQLALAQEGKKGFPQGIPQVALPALPPELAEQLLGMQEQEGMEREPEGAEYAKKGGSTFSGNAWYQQGGIQIDPAKKGTFKAQATRMDIGIQEAAAHILANKDQYSPEMVKKANFARNFAKEEGGLIEYQKRGEVRYPVYSPNDFNVLGNLGQNNTIGMPSNARYPGTYPAMQSKNKTGVYGEESWWDAAHQADFAKRHPDFINNATNWDPRTPGAALAFQKTVNPQLVAAGLSPIPEDDKFGERTYSVPSLAPFRTLGVRQPQAMPVNMPAPSIDAYDFYRTQYENSLKDTNQETAAPAPAAAQKQVAQKQVRDPRTGMLMPDKAALLQGLFTRAGIPTLTPFVQAPDYVLPETVFADPTRQYAAVAEQANMQNQGLRTFGRPQANLAGASQIAGKQLEAISNIGAQTNMQNASIANQANAVNAATINQNMAARAQAANMLGEMNNKYNLENFSMRDAADKQILAAYQNAFSNRAKVDALNKTSPYFTIDPRTGLQVQKAGVDIANLATNGKPTGDSDPFKQYMALKQRALDSGMNEKEAEDYIKQLLGANKTTSTYGSSGALDKTAIVQRQMLAGLASLFPNAGASAYPFSGQGFE
jgi:hypothetical protein